MTKTNQSFINHLKDNNEDFDFYPTTQAIIDTVKKYLNNKISYDEQYKGSVLEIGCGDGRVISQITTGQKYGIEKSRILASRVPSSVYIIGRDFYEQNLIDTNVDTIFTNPPYNRGEYKTWLEKVITEANCNRIIFVTPTEWRKSKRVSAALKARNASYEIIETTNFEGCDRNAAIEVDIVVVRYNKESIKAFDLWFNNNFNLPKSVTQTTSSEYLNQENASKLLQEQLNKHNATRKNQGYELVKATSYVETLVELYNNRMNKLINNYLAINQLDPEIIREAEIKAESVKAAIKLKIHSTKYVYWKELFSNLEALTKRFTSKTRDSILDTIYKNASVEFNKENAFAITEWVIKSFNDTIDEQFINFYETLSDRCNVENYKSNKRVFSDDDWLYNKPRKDVNNYKITDRRIVVQDTHCFTPIDEYKKLDSKIEIIINDFISIAGNLGFDTCDTEMSNNFEWVAGKSQKFYFRNHLSNNKEILIDVKVFKKGTIHIKANSELMLRMNCHIGKLKGWIRSPQDAADEFDIPLKKAIELIDNSRQIDYKPQTFLGIC